MKSLLIVFTFLFIFTNCEKRKCECLSDTVFTWKDDLSNDRADILLPNAVLNVGNPLALKISSIGQPLEWKLQSAKIFKDGQIFIDSDDPSDYIKNNSVIEFSHEIFSSAKGGIVTGPVSVEIKILFTENGELLIIDGTIFFYGCENIVEDFNPEDCRWSSQITGTNSFNPC